MGNGVEVATDTSAFNTFQLTSLEYCILIEAWNWTSGFLRQNKMRSSI